MQVRGAEVPGVSGEGIAAALVFDLGLTATAGEVAGALRAFDQAMGDDAAGAGEWRRGVRHDPERFLFVLLLDMLFLYQIAIQH